MEKIVASAIKLSKICGNEKRLPILGFVGVPFLSLKVFSKAVVTISEK